MYGFFSVVSKLIFLDCGVLVVVLLLNLDQYFSVDDVSSAVVVSFSLDLQIFFPSFSDSSKPGQQNLITRDRVTFWK